MSQAGAVFRQLAGGPVVIIDGGTGSELQAQGVPMDSVAWSARANLEHLGAVQRVHETYIRAGAQVIIANTYAASRSALTPAGLGDHVAQVNRNAVRAALAARDAAAAGPVAVAGSMSSFSPIDMDASAVVSAEPSGDDPRFPGRADFEEQAGLLAGAGVDLIVLEMISARGYGREALQAAAATGLPVWLGVSPVRRADGTLGTLPDLGDGDSFSDLLAALTDPPPAAVAVMHARPGVTLDAIGAVRRHFAGPVGVYAENGGWEPPLWVFDGLSPEQYRREAAGWAAAGAAFIGGCCGVGPRHIEALAQGLPRS